MSKKQNPSPKNNSRSLQLPGNSKSNLWLTAGVIILVTFFSFSPSLKNQFVNWDDNAYVFANPHLAKPLPEATSYFFGPHSFVGNYIPLTMMAYALEYKAAGLSPSFYHKINLFLHLLNVLLVFWFIFLLSKRKILIAALVALFFGIHPMHVESVAWVSELKDVLYSFFFVAGLITYLNYLETTSQKIKIRSLTLTGVYFLFSLLSKPSAVAFPLTLLLLDFYTNRKFIKQVWLEKIPFFLFSILFGIIALKSQDADRLLHNFYSSSQRFFFASHSLLNYLVKLFLPLDLSIFYPYPVLEQESLPSIYYISPILVLLLFYCVYRSVKFSKLIVFGFLFFLINIVFVLQLISVGDAVMADRYTYVPYIGIFFILAMGFDSLYHSTSERLKTLRPLALILVTVLGLTCSYQTYSRCKVWENDVTIANDLLEKYPNDCLALNNKGFILMEQRNYEAAIPLFSKAIQIKPDYTRASINLTDCYLTLNNLESALKTVDSALVHANKDVNLLNKKGNILFTQKNYSLAIKFYSEAIQAQKENMNSYIFLSETYYVIQDYESAKKILDAGLVYEPQNYLLLNNKGYMLYLQQRYDEAIDYFQSSLKSKPDYATASVNLENCIKAKNASIKK